MGVDAGGLVVAVISVAVSVAFTLWFTRQQTTAAKKQAKAAIDQAESAKAQARSAEESARAAQRQVELTEQVRREQAEPYVVVDIRPSDHVSSVFLLIIENVGPTVARNVQIQFDPLLERTLETSRASWKPIRDALLFTSGIPLMPPGRRMEWFFDMTPARFSSTLPMHYTVTVEADGPFGAVEPLVYQIDLAIYGGINRLGVKNVHDGVKALEQLVKETSRVSAALARPLPVWFVQMDTPESGDE
ncbi:hypothetical protein GCM10023085_45050 [Actinomadura viridis]|uniref:Type II secretory pathway pseudopilin PulG n=1 Tax=Actinomadura viridis TaxID=58110 RepID=A0A931GK33_9ACTN|nr:hypothetical protein [Actinomadura viridis]MBG6089867.1 type II secretory pathway pseudopilin PulG [Actinomadura viridis]